MDGNPAEAIEVPEAKGWAYGVGKVKLRGMELTEGKHTLTFAFDNSDYKYYFLESFTLVPRNK